MVMAHAPKNEFVLAPEGNHLATCYRVIDLGTQKNNFDPSKPDARKVLLTWELPHESMENGSPFSISNKYTLSLHEKSTLFKHLVSWRGRKFTDDEAKAFNVSTVLGKSCMLQVAHEIKGDKSYDNVAAIASLPKGTIAPALVNKIVDFDLDNFNQGVFETLSDGIKKMIMASPQYQNIMNEGMPL